MDKLLIVLFFLIQSLALSAQTPDPDVYNESEVTLDLRTLKFDKILPFDRPFLIHLKNIDQSYNTVRIEIYKNQDAAISLKKKKDIDRKKQAKEGIIVSMKTWNRPNGGTTITEGEIVQPDRLSPVSDYIVKISAGSRQPLTTSQSNTLSEALKNNKDIGYTINQIAEAAPDKPASILSKYIRMLDKQFEDAIIAFNSDYVFEYPDWMKSLVELSQFRSKLLEAGSQVTELADDEKDSIDSTDLKQLVDLTKAIDWGTIDITTSPIWFSLTSVIKKIHDAHSAAIATTLENIQGSIEDAIKARDNFRDVMVDQVAIPNTTVLNTLNSTYRGDFVNNAKLHINLDAGFAYVGRVDRAMAYSGFNIYFRPVDKTIPLHIYTKFRDIMAVRTSLLIGISLTSIEKDNERKGLIDNKAFIIGAGFRLVSFLKLNGGVFCHYRYDKNPVIDPERYHFTMSPFVSFSMDLDVKPLFNGLSDSLFK